MALLHQATLSPTKLELLTGWLPTRDWYRGPAGPVDRVATYRFDDPAGKVGIESLLVRAGDGPVYQVPLTYREAPLPDADHLLLGTTEHSVLGTRWVYDAAGDPVYAAALAGAIFANTGQAELLIEVNGVMERRDPTMTITGEQGEVPAVTEVVAVTDADPTIIDTGAVRLAVVRDLSRPSESTGATLRGTWPGQPVPTPLAHAL